MKKCPICNNELIKIVYGLPSTNLIEKAKKREVYLGGCCVIDNVNYHCYTCNRDITDKELNMLQKRKCNNR